MRNKSSIFGEKENFFSGFFLMWYLHYYSVFREAWMIVFKYTILNHHINNTASPTKKKLWDLLKIVTKKEEMEYINISLLIQSKQFDFIFFNKCFLKSPLIHDFRMQLSGLNLLWGLARPYLTSSQWRCLYTEKLM